MVARKSPNWRDKWYFYWRYGYSFYQTMNLVRKVKEKFLNIYNIDFPFEDIDEFLEYTQLDQLIGYTAYNFFKKNIKGGNNFLSELLPGITRNIYSIDSNLHAVAASIALIGGICDF